MNKHRRSRWLRRVLVWVVFGAAFVVVAASFREPILRAAGWALVVDEPIGPTDIIVISLGSGGAGALEAADLVQGGIAPRVAVFADPPSGEDQEFVRRGLPYDDASVRQISQLQWLGVRDVAQIPRGEMGTRGEAESLREWCDRNGVRSVVVVTASDHSRRFRRVLDRAFDGDPARIAVRPARYSSFHPDRWWASRSGVRVEIIEMQKLALDFVLHPI